MSSTAPDLEARLRRDLAELAAIPRGLPTLRAAAERPRHPLAAVALAAAVVAVLLAAAFAIARVAGRDASPVRPAHGTATPPRPGPTAAPPDSSAASETSAPGTNTTPTTIGVALDSVEWNAVVYPMTAHCGTTFDPPVVVQQVAYATPPGGGRLAIVMTRCNSGAGSPPSSLYVYDGATSRLSPHLAATLVADSDGWQAGAFTVAGATVSLPVGGFSTDAIPRCCPDVNTTLVWHWTGAAYHLDTTVPPHRPGPPSTR